MNENKQNRHPLPYSTEFAAADERMIMQLTPQEHEIANDIIDEHLKQLTENCGGRTDLIPMLLDGYMRVIICGEDSRYLVWGINQQDFTDECILAVTDDICYDFDNGCVCLDAAWFLEQCLIDIVGELLAAHHLFRAAHNALNVLVAYKRILIGIYEEQTKNFDNTKQPEK